MKSFAPVAAVLGASLVAAVPNDPIQKHVIDLQKRQFGGFGGKTGGGKSGGGLGGLLGGLGGGMGGMGGMGGLFGGSKVADPPGAAPRRVELQNRVTNVPGVKAVKLRYGPYKVPNMKIKNFLGEEGALWNYPDPRVDKPCNDDCTIVGMNAGLEYPDGKNANIDTGLWLHHMVLFNVGPGRVDATCGKSPISLPHMIVGSSPQGSERLFSSGNERTKAIMPLWNETNVGYKLKSADRFALIVDLMNETNEDKVVYLTISYDYIQGHPANYDEMKPVWFDVAQCLTSEWPAPYQTGRYSIPSQFWQPTFEGKIIGAAGHLHDGGQNVRLEVDGNVVCDSKASYATKPEFVSKMSHGGGATEHISEMSTCVGPSMLMKDLKKDQKWQLRADYNYDSNKGSHHGDGKQSNVMGIAIMFVRVKK